MQKEQLFCRESLTQYKFKNDPLNLFLFTLLAPLHEKLPVRGGIRAIGQTFSFCLKTLNVKPYVNTEGEPYVRELADSGLLLNSWLSDHLCNTVLP